MCFQQRRPRSLTKVEWKQFLTQGRDFVFLSSRQLREKMSLLVRRPIYATWNSGSLSLTHSLAHSHLAQGYGKGTEHARTIGAYNTFAPLCIYIRSHTMREFCDEKHLNTLKEHVFRLQRKQGIEAIPPFQAIPRVWLNSSTEAWKREIIDHLRRSCWILISFNS